MFISASHWSSFRPLALAHTLTGSLLEHPVVTLSHGGLAGIVPQGQSLRELQQVLDGVGVKVDQPKAQPWAWVVSELLNLSIWGHPLRQGGYCSF